MRAGLPTPLFSLAGGALGYLAAVLSRQAEVPQLVSCSCSEGVPQQCPDVVVNLTNLTVEHYHNLTYEVANRAQDQWKLLVDTGVDLAQSFLLFGGALISACGSCLCRRDGFGDRAGYNMATVGAGRRAAFPRGVLA